MVGLTQAEVAQRAGLTRQMIGSYESGKRCPSVGTLERLLAGCGLRLRLSVVPEPGLEDVPTLALLKLPPRERVQLPVHLAMLAVAESLHDCRSVIVTGKTAARLRGACVRVLELELWVPWRQPIEEIRAWLVDARIRELDALMTKRSVRGCGSSTASLVTSRSCSVVRRSSTATSLDRRLWTSARRMVRNPRWSTSLAADDCCVGWHPRDLRSPGAPAGCSLDRANDLMRPPGRPGFSWADDVMPFGPKAPLCLLTFAEARSSAAPHCLPMRPTTHLPGSLP